MSSSSNLNIIPERQMKQALPGWVGAVVLVAAVGCTAPPAWRTQLESVGIRFISARELKVMLDRDELLTLVDARVPSRSPPKMPPWRPWTIRHPKRLLHPERLPQDRGRVLVFYCGGPT